MNRRETKKHIEQLKEQLKTDHEINDFRLLKLALVMLILAIIAALVHGRLQLW